MRVDIRPAIYPDLPKLADVKLSAREEDPNDVRFGSELQYLTEFLDEHQSVFVLLVDKEPIAFCAVRDCHEKPFVGYAYVKDLYVLPQFQNKGYGKKLLMHTLRTMRSSGYMNAVLQTAESNAGARRFYERFGFEKRGGGASSGYVTYTIDF